MVQPPALDMNDERYPDINHIRVSLTPWKKANMMGLSLLRVSLTLPMA